MLLSMTGYGKSNVRLGDKSYSVEIKSLNSKQLDINTRIPAMYREKDIEIRRLISEMLTRGKVDFALYLDNLGAESTSRINAAIIKDQLCSFTGPHTEFVFLFTSSVLAAFPFI